MGKHKNTPCTDDGVDFAVELDRAQDPLVMTLDIGSTATRGSVHDATGTPVRGYRHKIPHAFTTAADGTSVIDPDQVVDEIREILDVVCDRKELAGRVRGVGMDSFASSLVGVDAKGDPVTECFTYADSRCAPQLKQMREELDERQVQQTVGARLHTSYLAPRFRWLAETRPEDFEAAERWLSIGEYVWLRLLGTTAAGTATAAWTGLLNRRSGNWDRRMLKAAGITADVLSPVLEPHEPLPDVDPDRTARWQGLADAQWFAPVADGLCANLGVGGSDEHTIVASAATSGAMRVLLHHRPQDIPPGLWCYRIDSSRCLLGGALNDVGRAVSWMLDTLALDGVVLDEIAAADPSPDTPGVLPFLTGERSTGWAGSARAVFADVSASTDASAMARGMLEGIAGSYRRVSDELERAATDVERIVAAGRVTQELPSWLQILGDYLGTPVIHQTIKRSTCRGNALLMLESLAPDVECSSPEPAGTYTPRDSAQEYYRGVHDRFERLYGAAVEGS
ncbi:gluconokinase [Kocuria marina]|uniref:Gluconokinase n=2 Tax=Kocuria TaxID=57493 RepID=A0A1X7DVY9_9MICC|nr:gluconokinase [Kocuria indica]OXS81202.1 sugar kinase [Kocuria indica]RLP57040.1 sugar kinase [Kocuria indica]SMF22672.1 gluconokinase [Kocuria indica]